jgi:4-alpha-glucanotransferase
MKLHFYLRFHTSYGQSLSIKFDKNEPEEQYPVKSIPMEYLNDQFWYVSIEIKRKELQKKIFYNYELKNEVNEIINEWGKDRSISEFKKEVNEIWLVDTWNHAGEYENVFFSDPFNNILLKSFHTKFKATNDKDFTHIFKVKAPLLKKNEAVCLGGAGTKLGEWTEINPLIMSKEADWWTININLSDTDFPLAYKYGVYHIKTKKFVRFEEGDNRLLYSDDSKKKVTVIHDGFIHLPNNTWKGSGVAIPVFSLRSKNSFGVGEFTDIKLLVDWAKETGLKLIQLLPINDTISTKTWMDSYPYSAISAFALHPLYINLNKVAGKENAARLAPLKAKQKQLNELNTVDYEEVIKNKLSVLKDLYADISEKCFEQEEYKKFFRENKHWLEPYAAFCYFRDKYGSAKYEEWKTNTIYIKEKIAKLCSHKSSSHNEIAFYYFTQYHLHLQLTDAVDYAHKKGIVLKGDIPIGISRNSSDAWMAPDMYNMDWQAGAPPDDFTAVGQNWEFPTYNWKKMQEDGFTWWKQRFSQMRCYFDAFRIDHILGFFRIWSIPLHAVQGIMGRFVPCIPVHVNEFGEKGIWFDYQRFCLPYITDNILYQIFGDLSGKVKDEFLIANNFEGYDFKIKFSTQRQVEEHFSKLEKTAENETIKLGLFDLIANVILFEESGSQGEQFHFRISMEKTESFRHLELQVQEKLKEIYINYFFKRQDDFWHKEAMHKLPQLKASTNMLICGEDLGMVPDCVPDSMKQLGILSLEIQRMPKDPKKEFFHPNDAPYMSVITPSTHDMSTIRGWWEENREKTQKFYNHEMGQWGTAPHYCEPWINRAIILQHLYSPAMWSIFQLQDILGMSDTLRRENPNEERINNPANPKHYWCYRMHLSLEELIQQKDFNEELKGYVENSGRGQSNFTR